MNNLVIDSGNTRVKWGIFKGRQLIHVGEVLLSELEGALRARNELAAIDQVLISNSGSLQIDWAKILPSNVQCRQVDYQMPLPIKISYQTPSTLGTDRIANAVAAAVTFPGKNSLIIDLGTCITYDLVENGAVYVGGAISPGLYMRLKAMHEFTARLPLSAINPEVDITGTSTLAAIQSGAFHGFKSEVAGMIQKFRQKYSDLHIILTGGDRVYFDADTKSSIFADANLTLTGLNEILLHYEK